MKKEKIVFNDTYGFGIVQQIENNNYLVKFFENEKLINIQNSDVETVNYDFIRFFVEDEFRKKFYLATLERGYDYFLNDRVKKIKYHDRTIEATVKGEYEYEVIFDYRLNKLNNSCSCPVMVNCKHVAATCYKLQSIFKILKAYGGIMVENKAKLSDEIINAYNKLKDQNNICENAKIIVDDLMKHDDDYLEMFYNRVDTYEYHNYSGRYSRYFYGEYENRDEKNYVVFLLSYNNSIRKRIYDIRRNESPNFARAIEEYLNKADVLTNKYVHDDFYRFANNRKVVPGLYLVFNGYYLDYIRYSLSSNSAVSYDYDLFNYCANQIEYSEQLEKIVRNSLYRSDIPRSYYTPVISKFPNDIKLEYYLNNFFQLEFGYRDIKDFKREDRIKLLPRCYIAPSDIESVLKNEIDLEKGDFRYGIKLLLRIHEQTGEDDLIIDYLKKVPNSEYFINYLENDDTYIYRSWFGEKRYLDSTRIDKDYSKINESAFTDYFDIEFEVEEEDEKYRVKHMLKDFNGNIVIDILEDNDSFQLLRDAFNDRRIFTLVYYLVWYIKNKRKDEYEKAVNKAKNNIQKNIHKRLCDEAKKDMAIVSHKAITNRLNLREDLKAKLEYSFYIDAESILRLRLKIGVDKMYVVKNAFEFLDNVCNRRSITYGKNFEITHSLENFCERDAGIISSLLKSNPIDYNDKRSFRINTYLAEDLIGQMKDLYVNYNDNSYYLRLEEKKPSISIDSDFVLHFGFDGIDNYEYICFSGYILIIDNDHKYFDRYTCDNERKNLFVFSYRFRGLCIKDILDEYKQSIYTHFYDDIKIADEIKDDFKLSIINIKAYFDYEDKSIKVRKEYYKNDAKIELNKIKDENDLMRIQILNQYLSACGFVDDVIEDEGKVLSFFYMDFSELKKYCEIYLSDSIKNKQVSTFKTATVKITYDGVIMKTFLEGSDYSDDELNRILSAIKKKKKYVLLDNDRIIDIDNKDSKEFYDTVNDLSLDQKHLNQESEISLQKALKALAHENNCELDDYLGSMIDEIRNFKNSKIALPKINGELRDYQKDGFRWLSILSKYNVGGILADDMGLGKTIEIISLLSASDAKKPSLIVCPKTVVFNWKNEINRFVPELEVKEIYGLKEERDKIISDINNKQKVVYISSYDSLRNDLDSYKTTFEYIVIDEAQYIKNVNALKTKSVKKLKANHKFALTGTPIENNIVDLWSIFDFIMPGYFDELSTFKSNYNGNENFVEVVGKRIGPFVLRRTKENVLKDLPDKYERVLTVEMEAEQRKLYDAFKKEVNDKLQSGSKAFDILPYLTRLRQICVNPKMFVDNYAGNVAKNELLSNILDEYIANGHKILIFSQFVKALEEVENLLKTKNIPYYMITGATNAKKRIAIADSFNNSSKEKVILISLKAGGTGMNLIGADTVIHLDPWWNVASENQASDRSHRIGQIHNVEVIKIICEKSIEQRVIELQNIKKDLIDKLIANDEKSVTNVTLDDIKFILD